MLYCAHIQNGLIAYAKCLLSEKSRRMYLFVFQIIKDMMRHLEINEELAWTQTMSDFETGLLPAITEAFPQVDKRCCHFHFCQAIFRKLCGLGLKAEYVEAGFKYFQTFVRCVFALSFLPIERIEGAFRELVHELELSYIQRNMPQRMIEFITYLLRVWIGENSRFPKQMWNVADLQDMRTNNLVEGWHRFASEHFGNGKNLWKFLSKLSAVELQTRAAIALVRGGEQVRNRKRSQERKERSLKRMKENYDLGNVYNGDVDYLIQLSQLQPNFDADNDGAEEVDENE